MRTEKTKKKIKRQIRFCVEKNNDSEQRREKVCTYVSMDINIYCKAQFYAYLMYFERKKISC